MSGGTDWGLELRPNARPQPLVSPLGYLTPGTFFPLVSCHCLFRRPCSAYITRYLGHVYYSDLADDVKPNLIRR
jgi:hypothetical protein